MERRKKICVVGAGASGLPSIRHALLYGFEVVCYESQKEIGGLWRFKPEETDESSVMKSTVINSSKELTAYSDFPPPAEEANFMHNTHMYGYLKSYAEHYKLDKYIKMGIRVLNVERSGDYVKTGRWKVHTQNIDSGETKSEEFDGVLMCTGHHTLPYWPEKWAGQDEFKGRIIHAHSYKDHKGYEDKTVVVVGIGNSGGDVAVELSRIAKQVYLVSRRGTWVFNRIYNYGRPIDCALNTRIFNDLKGMVPYALTDFLARRQLNQRFDHETYGLQPQHPVFSAHPTVNDELPNRIACGTVRVKPQIQKFEGKKVFFTDGSVVEDVDDVIVSTGYSFEFPAIEKGNLIKVKDNEVDLYQYVFPMACEHDTLAIIGLIQPYGSIMPISEMQARVVLDVMAGKTKLPSKEQRRANAEGKRNEMSHRYVKSRRHTIQVDYIPYMDELAQLIDCTPPKWYSVVLNDPVLAGNLLLAPLGSYFYRLRGPHPWSGARDAIVHIEDRVLKATNTKQSGTVFSTRNEGFMAVLFFAGLTFAVLAVFWHFIASIL